MSRRPSPLLDQLISDAFRANYWHTVPVRIPKFPSWNGNQGPFRHPLGLHRSARPRRRRVLTPLPVTQGAPADLARSPSQTGRDLNDIHRKEIGFNTFAPRLGGAISFGRKAPALNGVHEACAALTDVDKINAHADPNAVRSPLADGFHHCVMIRLLKSAIFSVPDES